MWNNGLCGGNIEIWVFLFNPPLLIAWFLGAAEHRNGLFWCYTHKNWTPNSCSQKDFCQTFFTRVYAKYLLMKPVKVLFAKLYWLVIFLTRCRLLSSLKDHHIKLVCTEVVVKFLVVCTKEILWKLYFLMGSFAHSALILSNAMQSPTNLTCWTQGFPCLPLSLKTKKKYFCLIDRSSKH